MKYKSLENSAYVYGSGMSVLGLGPLKAAFLCFVSSALVTAFKVLYKESIETVDRPSTKPPTKKSDRNGFRTCRHFL